MRSRLSLAPLAAGLLAVADLAAASAHLYSTRFNGTIWDDTNWRITTFNLDQGHFQSRMSLANGYLGINVAAVGPFFEVDTPVNGDDINGWPLFDRRQTFATVGGFYDEQAITEGTNFAWLNQYGGESVISGVPHWAGLVVQVGNDTLDAGVPASQISSFSSSLDVKHAVLSWDYAWTPPSSGVPITVSYEMFVHKLHVNKAAVQLRLSAPQSVDATVIDVLDGDCAVRTNFVDKGYDAQQPVIFSAVKPNNSNTEFFVTSVLQGGSGCQQESRREYTIESVIGGNSSSIAQAIDVKIAADQQTTITKYIGAASSTAFENPQSISLNKAWDGAHAGWDSLLESHSAEWSSIFTEDSVESFRFENGSLPDDANIVELQITAITNPFQLLMNTVGANAIADADNNQKLDVNSISVCGLGSDCYAGLIFWDAEVWMAPGLVAAFPQAAKQIAKYRVEKFPQAQANIHTAYQSSENQTGKFSNNGAVFPWTSGGFGNCTGTGPCFDYEYHLNGDIGLELFNYYAVTGDNDFFQQELFPVYDAVAQFYADLVTLNKTTGLYELYNATDPDEYANFVTNPGYTMALMRTHIDTANALRARFGEEPNATWADIADKITIPVDESAGLILEYTSMLGNISVKQADVVLIDDFLDLPNAYSLTDLDYYAGRQSADGPGMTYAVFSIVANKISPSGCSSYTYDLYSTQPYLRGPWFQFSEQLIDDYSENGGTHPAYPFLTGVGGANRVNIFGYLGLHLNIDTFNVDPSLPPQIPQLEYRTIYWQGWPIKARSNQTHTTLTRLSTPLDNANSTFASASIPVTIGLQQSVYAANSTALELAPGGTITISNRAIGDIATVAGNIAQCLPVDSSDAVVPGQFALSAVDGAISTKWQPVAANTTSSLAVRLRPEYAPIDGLAFDWAQAPPQSFRVYFHNGTSASDSSSILVASQDTVAISHPYNAATAVLVAPYSSNTTNVTLSTPVWSANYATLEIEGSQANGAANGVGATVAEFAIVAVGGARLL